MPQNTLGQTLLFDPNALFRTWNINDIYMGPGSNGRVIPNVDDLVFDWNSGMYRVISVADVAVNGATAPTYIPILRYFDVSSVNGDGSLLGNLTRYQPSIMERAFFDPLTTPYVLTFDDRFRSYGSESVEYKVFMGTNTTSTGTVISTRLNAGGTVVSENFLLESIDPSNPAIKRPVVTNVSTNLLDGDTVTLVTYTNAGGPVGEHPFRVKHGNVIRSVEASTTYIQDITLVSNLIDSVELDLLKVLVNTSLMSTTFQAMVHYSDGSTALLPVDGTKIKLHGIDNFNSANLGVISNITLTYYADPNEAIINVSNPLVRSLSRVYRVQPIQATNTVGFKLFVSPKFNSASNSYDLRYHLGNVEHDVLLPVDPSLVTATQNGGVVNTTKSSGTAVIDLTLTIADVIPSGYTGLVLSQTVTITFGDIVNNGTPWILDYTNDGSRTFGVGRHLQYSDAFSGGYALSPTSGETVLADWKYALYETVKPLFDPNLTLAPIDPTHFYLQYEGIQSPPIDITAFQSLHNNLLNHSWTLHDTVDIVWLKLDTVSGNMLKLGLSPFMITNTL